MAFIDKLQGTEYSTAWKNFLRLAGFMWDHYRYSTDVKSSLTLLVKLEAVNPTCSKLILKTLYGSQKHPRTPQRNPLPEKKAVYLKSVFRIPKKFMKFTAIVVWKKLVFPFEKMKIEQNDHILHYCHHSNKMLAWISSEQA